MGDVIQFEPPPISHTTAARRGGLKTRSDLFQYMMRHVNTIPPLVPVGEDLSSLTEQFVAYVLKGWAFRQSLIAWNRIFSAIDWHRTTWEEGPRCSLKILSMF